MTMLFSVSCKVASWPCSFGSINTLEWSDKPPMGGWGGGEEPRALKTEQPAEQDRAEPIQILLSLIGVEHEVGALAS